MSEAKRVIWQILLIYLVSMGIFLAVFFVLWYQKLYEDIINDNTKTLKDFHRTIVLSIVNSKYTPLEQSCENIARVSGIKFAVLDERQIFCSNLSIDISDLNVSTSRGGIYEDYAFYINAMDTRNYFLGDGDDRQEELKQRYIQNGALRTFIQGASVENQLFSIKIYLITVMLTSLALVGFVGYFLVKIALKPLHEKITTLNSFIKDFTHEINTPLSVILLSIEQIEHAKNEVNPSKFQRMKLAARTLSQTYSDLLFYTFPDKMHSSEEELDMQILLKERLEYFKPFFEQKKLKVKANLSPAKLFAGKNKINKMCDNIISNAVKYNKKEGDIELELRQGYLRIKDSGCGIESKNLKNIFNRYTRFNNDQGGFGIGLNLVQGICKEYNIRITCNSELGKGSEFIFEWQ